MYQQYRPGWVEVITGCMFAGKTEELIRRINVLKYAKKNIVVFKPTIDNRYSDMEVVSHSGARVKCVNAESTKQIVNYVRNNSDIEVIAIDEIQFFDNDITIAVDEFAKKGLRVMCAGLDMDFRGEPFPVIAKLLSTSEFVTKLTAVCHKCGAPATRSQRLVNGEPAKYSDPTVLVGAAEAYEARCRHCHIVEGAPSIDE